MDSKKGHCPMDITCTLHRYPDTTILHHVDMSKTKNSVLNLLKLIRCKKVQLYLIFRLIHGVYFIARRFGGKISAHLQSIRYSNKTLYNTTVP